MASKADIHLVLIWEDELRAAAKALKKAHEASDDEFTPLASAAFNACLTALWGVTDDCALAMLASADIRNRIGPVTPPSASADGI